MTSGLSPALRAMYEETNDEVSRQSSETMLGYSPGYTPSREFLEASVQYLKRIVINQNMEYVDALDDLVRSIYRFKTNSYKKDHRVFMHKKKRKRCEEVPLNEHELKLRDDIKRYLLANCDRQLDVVRSMKASYARKAAEELACPKHKKDCCTELYKKQDIAKGGCEWYRQHEHSVQRNRANYFGLDKNSSRNVHFKGSDDDDDDVTPPVNDDTTGPQQRAPERLTEESLRERLEAVRPRSVVDEEWPEKINASNRKK